MTKRTGHSYYFLSNLPPYDKMYMANFIFTQTPSTKRTRQFLLIFTQTPSLWQNIWGKFLIFYPNSFLVTKRTRQNFFFNPNSFLMTKRTGHKLFYFLPNLPPYDKTYRAYFFNFFLPNLPPYDKTYTAIFIFFNPNSFLMTKRTGRKF